MTRGVCHQTTAICLYRRILPPCQESSVHCNLPQRSPGQIERRRRQSRDMIPLFPLMRDIPAIEQKQKRRS
jgi:hypothetical protein